MYIAHILTRLYTKYYNVAIWDSWFYAHISEKICRKMYMYTFTAMKNRNNLCIQKKKKYSNIQVSVMLSLLLL